MPRLFPLLALTGCTVTDADGDTRFATMFEIILVIVGRFSS